MDKVYFKASKEVNAFEGWPGNGLWGIIWEEDTQGLDKGSKIRNPLASVTSCPVEIYVTVFWFWGEEWVKVIQGILG